MESGLTNLIMAMGKDLWPCTLRLSRVVIAPDQKLHFLMEAVELARKHFDRPKGLDTPHYYLTPIYMEAPYLFSDAGLPAKDRGAIPIGVGTFGESRR